jgi:RHS repeat-associated protein
MTDPIGRVATTQYDANGLPMRIVPVVGTESALGWDGPRLTSVLQGTSEIYYEYEATYNQPTRISGTRPEQLFTYDSTKAGRPLLTSRVASTPVDSATRYLFTLDGRIQSVTDALGHGTTWTYLPTGAQNVIQATEMTTSGEKKTTFAYDAYGRTTAVTDPTSAVFRTFYDQRNRITSTVGSRADTTRFGYDGLGNVTQVTDPRGQLYQYVRNVLGWALTQTGPSATAEEFRYDPSGLVTTYVNRRGQAIATTYDSLDRIKTVYQNAEGQTTTFGYDPAGRWASVANGASIDTVKLNANFLVEQQITVRPDFTRSVRASYNGNQRRTGVNVLLNGAAGDSITYGYGSAGQLTSIRDPLGRVTTIGYDSDYLPKAVTFAGGLVATNSFSGAHALTGTSFNVVGVNQQFWREYTRDSLDRVRESSDLQNKVRRFAYDPAGELLSHGDFQTSVPTCHFDKDYGRVCTPGSESYLGGRSYAYDLVGNPTDAGVSTGTANRMTVIGGDSLVYDADGNMTRRYRVGSPWTFDQTLTWNSLGQLTQVVTTRSGAANTLQFLYDGFGRRIQRMVPLVGSMQYVWDGDQTVVETAWNGATARAYTYYPGTDQLHSVVTGGQTYYAALDAAGNVLGLVNAATNVVSDVYAYQPFGVMDRNDQNVPNSLRWKGLQYDAESGLYYVRARYYAPDLGRFVSEDPIGLDGGINQYRFAGNDPVNYSDPSGMVCAVVTNGGLGGAPNQTSINCDPWWRNAVKGLIDAIEKGRDEGPIAPDAKHRSLKQNYCSTIHEVSVGFSALAGGWGVIGPFGGLNLNVGVNSAGQFFASASLSATVGSGYYVGGGFAGSYGQHSMAYKSGVDAGIVNQINANVGVGLMAYGAQITSDPSGWSASPSGGRLSFGGVGVGAQVSGGKAAAVTASTPNLLCQ